MNTSGLLLRWMPELVSGISLQQGTLGLIGLQRLSVLLPERFDSRYELSAPSAVPDGLKPLALSPEQ